MNLRRLQDQSNYKEWSVRIKLYINLFGFTDSRGRCEPLSTPDSTALTRPLPTFTRPQDNSAACLVALTISPRQLFLVRYCSTVYEMFAALDHAYSRRDLSYVLELRQQLWSLDYREGQDMVSHWFKGEEIVGKLDALGKPQPPGTLSQAVLRSLPNGEKWRIAKETVFVQDSFRKKGENGAPDYFDDDAVFQHLRHFASLDRLRNSKCGICGKHGHNTYNCRKEAEIREKEQKVEKQLRARGDLVLLGVGEESCTILRLADQAGYLHWRFQVTWLLKAQGFWDIVNGSCPRPEEMPESSLFRDWKRRDAQATYVLLNVVTDDLMELFHSYVEEKSAAALWKRIEAHFVNPLVMLSGTLWQELWTCRYVDGDSMEDHIFEIERIVMRLEDLGYATPGTFAEALLASLPKETWRHFIRRMTHELPSKTSLDDLKVRQEVLQSAEELMRYRSGFCSHCQKDGHWVAHCRTKKRKDKQKENKAKDKAGVAWVYLPERNG